MGWSLKKKFVRSGSWPEKKTLCWSGSPKKCKLWGMRFILEMQGERPSYLIPLKDMKEIIQLRIDEVNFLVGRGLNHDVFSVFIKVITDTVISIGSHFRVSSNWNSMAYGPQHASFFYWNWGSTRWDEPHNKNSILRYYRWVTKFTKSGIQSNQLSFAYPTSKFFFVEFSFFVRRNNLFLSHFWGAEG